jgi:hypothetical protein
MPRYYLSVTGQAARPDPIGRELADLDEARRCAIRHMARLMRDEPTTFLQGRHQLDVTDGDGVVLVTLVFSSTEGVSSPALPPA